MKIVDSNIMMKNPDFGLGSFYARGCIGGCIVELYQFRCTDESMLLWILYGSFSNLKNLIVLC